MKQVNLHDKQFKLFLDSKSIISSIEDLAIKINRTDNPNGTTSTKSTLLFRAKPLSPAIKKSKAAIKKGKNDKEPKK